MSSLGILAKKLEEGSKFASHPAQNRVKNISAGCSFTRSIYIFPMQQPETIKQNDLVSQVEYLLLGNCFFRDVNLIKLYLGLLAYFGSNLSLPI